MLTTLDKQAGPEERFLAAFDIHEGHTLNGTNARIHTLRKDAITAFKTLGFPSPKAELWKYTNIGKVLTHDFPLHLKDMHAEVSEADLAPVLIPDLDGYRVVMVNGRLDPNLSRLSDLPEGLTVCSLSEALENHGALFQPHFAKYADISDEAFTALNTAFTQFGLFIHAAPNTVVEKPVYVINLTRCEEDLFLLPRLLMVAERNAQLRVVEQGASLHDKQAFLNSVTESYTGPNARLDHYKVQDEGFETSQVATLFAYQEADSYFSTNTVTLSGRVVRNNLTFLPNAEHCETHLLGLFLAQGTMHVDNHTLVDHAQPNCFSNELYKGILDDKSTGVFNGKVLVRQDAQKTNAYQSNKTVLLSDNARMYSKPELEIYADDVKCSHGATTGQLDAEALFYLRSRGLTPLLARKMLLLAFARNVLEEIKVEPLRAYLDHQIAIRLK